MVNHFLADSLSPELDDPQIGEMLIHFDSRIVGTVPALENIVLGPVVTTEAADVVGDNDPYLRT